jgi:hypothetical protein
MRARVGFVGILVLISVLGAGAPPTAWSRSNPTCTFSAILTLDPGLSSVFPSEGTFETAHGDEGTYQCRSPFGFGDSTGQATGHGRYGTRDEDTCSDGGEGEGTLKLYDQRASRSGSFTFTYSPFSSEGTSMGEFKGDRFEGTFTLTALNGEHDCLKPVTKVRLDGKGWVTS